MKVLHVLASNKYSGAENVACQIIEMFKNDRDTEMAYCSPEGPISETLKNKNILYIPIKKVSLSEIKKVIKEYNPDVIHCHDLKASILCSFVKDIKIISHIHGNKSNMSRISLKSLMYKVASRNIKNILWVSNSCYQDFIFKNSVRKKSIVLPNIISIQNLEKNVKADPVNYDNFDIVFLGRLVFEKNPLRLIEIAKLIKEEINDFKFAIVGDGVLRKEVETKIKEYSLQKNIELFGFKNNPYKLLSSGKIMLMTSVMEGTPMCALEALSLGLPVISTKTDGMVDLIHNGGNGYLYDTDIQAKEIICSLLKNNENFLLLKKQSIEFAKEYNNIHKYKKVLERIYLG